MYTIRKNKNLTPRILRDLSSLDYESGILPSNINTDKTSQSIPKSIEVILSINDILEPNDFGKLEDSRFLYYIRYISEMSIHKRKLTPIEVSELERFIRYIDENVVGKDIVREFFLYTKKGEIGSYETFRRACDILLNDYHSDSLKFSLQQLHRAKTRGFSESISSFEKGVAYHASKLHIYEVCLSE